MIKQLLLLTIGLGIFPLINAQNSTFEWVRQIGGLNEDFGSYIAIDNNGDVYSIGRFRGTADLDPGIGVLNFTSMGESDIYIQKLDANGSLLWVKHIQGAGDDYGEFIAIDISGNVYSTGYFQGTVDFDPGSGVTNLTSVGSLDAFILKLDANGNFLWAKQIGGTSVDIGRSIATDGAGNAYTVGRYRGTVDFDPGVGIFNLTAVSADDVFIQKLDSNGNFVWAKDMGGGSFDIGNSIAIDGNGNVYSTGYFRGTVDFDPGTGITNLNSAGGADIFIQKLDSGGNLLWVKRIGGTSYEYGYSITADINGNVYTTGYFQGTADFDPGPATFNLTPIGGNDAFILKLNASGNLMWAKQIGGTLSDEGNSIITDMDGNVYTTGRFEYTTDFDPGPGITNLTSMGGSDIFIEKLDSNGNFIWAKQMGGTNYDYGYSIDVDNNGNIYSTGMFQETVDFDPGSGVANLISIGSFDIYIQKLSNCVPDLVSEVITACDSFTWIDGVTYTANNTTATHILMNVDGCDSLVTLNLTIINSSIGDTIVTACDSFSWHGTIYTNSAAPTHTLASVNGCDSVVTLDLTIETIDNAVSQTGIVLTANATGYTYQWVDCNNANAPIIGDTNKNFTPTVNGSYAVEISSVNCTEISSCMVINSVGIETLAEFGIKIYPNPSNGQFMIDVKANCEVEIVNAIGEIIVQQKLNSGANYIDISTMPNGLYFIHIKTNDTVYSKRVVLSK